MIKKNDFIELDFTAKLKENGMVFDTTISEEAKKAGIPGFKELKPVKICVGHGMIIKGLDNSLIGKEIQKEYSIEVEPKDAFGMRNPSLVRVVSEKIFLAQEMLPQRGMMVTLDGLVARVTSVSGGRVMVDFNNPLSGKFILYTFKIKRIIADQKEKLAVLTENLLKIKQEDAEIRINNNVAEIEIKKDDNRILENKKIVSEFEKKTKELVGIEAKLKKQEHKHEQKTEQKAETHTETK